MQPAKPDSNSNSPYHMANTPENESAAAAQPAAADTPKPATAPNVSPAAPAATSDAPANPALLKAADIKGVLVAVTKAAAVVAADSVVVAVVDAAVVVADAAVHAAKSALLLPTTRAMSSPRRSYSSTDAQLLQKADVVSVSQPSWFAETRKAKSA